MPELRRIAKEAVSKALDKAERYRLLNDPMDAESICLDILEADPDDQRALVTLLLALSDQFDEHLATAFPRAQELLPRLADDYARAYYGALLAERRAKAHKRMGAPGSGPAAYEWLRRALAGFERAIELRPAGNDEAILRWNACVRMLARDPTLQPAAADAFQPLLE